MCKSEHDLNLAAEESSNDEIISNLKKNETFMTKSAFFFYSNRVDLNPTSLSFGAFSQGSRAGLCGRQKTL